jgi:hypothetical protein
MRCTRIFRRVSLVIAKTASVFTRSRLSEFTKRVVCLPVYFGSLKFMPLLGSTIQQLAPTRANAR